MRPVRVLDDGKKTYIQMTPNAAHREIPVLAILGPKGPEMVNYRVKGDMYIVDRLFERGALILGAGKKSRKAEIIRATYRGKVKGDPYGSIPGAQR
jgi:type IV secretion system protein VirB9